MPLYLLASAFTIWMAVEAVRRGDARSWLWIILVFGPMGAAIYFITEYVGAGALNRITFRTGGYRDIGGANPVEPDSDRPHGPSLFAVACESREGVT